PSPRIAGASGVAHGPPAAAKALAGGDQVEVDRADDGEPGSLARNGSTGHFRRTRRFRRVLRAASQATPWRGNRSLLATRSRLAEPTPVSGGSGGKRAQVVHGPAEQVFAQVEEAGPERRAVWGQANPRGLVEYRQRPQSERERA